ncbi:polysaccharide biosynthesis/export family protein [Jannaschia sp. S6380]|uniref:polysaccharide biosynthesis/export family protein n=1 Tax=Jannaschia sp. S6380 TaxID=2926408 RepID=UPI001FF5B5C8|nr:polysaccharide biosynthesis/export family protein [Jannaschia sp. S6380]MCK0168689.1 polysaccharide biosynthesis/export family protein [Jannaschia sp. S6380]
MAVGDDIMRIIRFFAVLACLGTLGGCALPRGAALQGEVVRASDTQGADFAVYPVTRALLPSIAQWPDVNQPHLGWITASQGSSAQVIRPGDMVTLTIWDSDINSLLVPAEGRRTVLDPMRVSPAGSIFVPYVGNVQIGGTTPQGARSRVEAALFDVAPSAQVQLSMAEGRGNAVDLVGGVRQPGSFPMPDGNFTVLGLVAAGGGVDPSLDNPQIRLQRGSRLYGTSIDRLYDEPRLDTLLRSGDQVIVQEDERYFLSVGAAGSEALHPFTRSTLSAMDAVSIIGGVQEQRADPKGILILREYPVSALAAGQRGPRNRQVIFTLDLTSADGLFSARNFQIMPKDLVYVTESPITATQTVFSLIGSVFGLIRTAPR